MYRLCTTVFLYPDAQRSAQLSEAAAEFGQYDPLLARFPFFGPWRRLLDTLDAPLARGLEELESEYVRLFLVGAGSVPCPLYESLYLEPQGYISGRREAQLEREYIAAGVVVDPGLGEVPDHVAVELEFMAHLCDQEARAWEDVAARGKGQGARAKGNEPGQQEPEMAAALSSRPLSSVVRPSSLAARRSPLVAQALERQRAFLNQHLGVWFPAFAQRVTATSRGGLYPAAAEAAAAFIHHDRDLVALLLATTGDGRPTADEGRRTKDEGPAAKRPRAQSRAAGAIREGDLGERTGR